MQRERIKLWGLYAAAGCSWLLAAYFVWQVIEHDSRRSMMWLLLCLTAAGSFTGAAVIVSSIKRLADAAFRLGYENGRRSHGCNSQPTLRVVNGDAVVVRLRADH